MNKNAFNQFSNAMRLCACIDTCVYPYLLFTLDRIFHRFLPLFTLSAAGLWDLCVCACDTYIAHTYPKITVKYVVRWWCWASAAAAAACSTFDWNSTDHLTYAMPEGDGEDQLWSRHVHCTAAMCGVCNVQHAQQRDGKAAPSPSWFNDDIFRVWHSWNPSKIKTRTSNDFALYPFFDKKGAWINSASRYRSHQAGRWFVHPMESVNEARRYETEGDARAAACNKVNKLRWDFRTFATI